MKKLMITTVLGSVAMVGSAFAQTLAPDAAATDPTTQTGDTQPTQGTEPMPADGAQPGMGAEADATGVMQSEGGFFTYQEGSQMLGSSLMGADVRGPDRESIGSVDDLLLDSDGQVIAVVVGIGGFLGIGQRDVAIANDQLEFVLVEEAAAAAPTDPAVPPAETVPADPAVPSGDVMATDPAAPAPEATATDPAAAPGTAGVAGTGPAGVAGTGTGWGWTGAGIDHIQVNYTREQLEAAPAFEAAE